MVRVLMVSAAGELGGAERSLLELAAALPRDRIEAHIAAPPDSALLNSCAAAGLEAHAVPIRHARYSLNPFKLAADLHAMDCAARAVARVARVGKFALLHANGDQAAMVVWRASSLSGIPFIWHCRDLRRRGRVWHELAHDAVCIVAISQAVAENLRQQHVKPATIKTIINGINFSRFERVMASQAMNQGQDARATMRAVLGLMPDKLVLLSAGAFVPWKKHELFFEALSILRPRLPDAAGLLAGSDLFGENPAYYKFLKVRVKQFGLDAGGLRLLGQHEDLPGLLAAADVFVSCSENEPFGRVLAEAGAAGLPVVATDSGAKAEIIEDGVTGLLTPPDATAVADACEKLLRDPALRARMGAAARERVARLFDVQRTAAEMAELFEAVAQ